MVRKVAAGLAVLVAWILCAPMAQAHSYLSWDVTDLGGGLTAFDVGIYETDGIPRSFAEQLTFTTGSGDPFNQELAFASLAADTLEDADNYAAIMSSNYDKNLDSYCFCGYATADWPQAIPPFNGLVGMGVGSNLVEMSFGTGGGSMVLSADLIRLVVPTGDELVVFGNIARGDTLDPGISQESPLHTGVTSGFALFTITTEVPEPMTATLMGLGLLGIGWMGRRS